MNKAIKFKAGQGFTMIELMIVVSIVAIITVIAIPSYQEYVKRARRADVQGALQGFAIAMERHRTEQAAPTYINAVLTAGSLPKPPILSVYADQAPLDGANKFYDLKISELAINSYTLQAIPINAQSSDRCGTFILNSSGVQDVSNLTTAECWR